MTFSGIRRLDKFLASRKSQRFALQRRKTSLRRQKRLAIVERLEERHLLAAVTLDLNGSDDGGIDFAATYAEGSSAALLQDGDLTAAAGTVVTRQPGSEFQVNTETVSNQTIGISGRGRYVASDANGNHTVVWISFGQDGNSNGIFGQRYDTVGVAAGGEFQVNTTTSGNQSNPSLTMDDAGNFLVVWEGNGPGDSTGVFGQRFNPDGTKAGGEFLIPTAATGNASRPVASMNGDGDFVVVWSNTEVYGQRFLADGSRVGSEFLVNPTQTGGQASVAMDDAGGFFVAWSTYGISNEIFGRRYASNGTAVTDEFQVNTFTEKNQDYVAVDIDDAGNSVVTWNSQDQDDYFGSLRDGIYGQRFDPIGLPVGGEFRITTNDSRDKRYSSLAMDSVGNFVVTWSSYFQDGSYYGVYGQRFYADGTMAGDEFLINETTDDDQQNPSVDLLDNGDFLTVWLNEPAPGEREVFGRYFRSASGLIDKATVSITNPLDGTDEVLTVDTSGTAIAAEYRNGLLTLSGVDSEANYQQVLRTVRYENTSEDPDTTDRQVEFVVRVAEFDSAVATSTLTVAAVNDFPEVAVSGSTAVTIGEGQLASISGTFSDVDSDDVVLTASIGDVLANNDGTWDWTFATSNDPAENGTVTITATDTEGDATTATFDLTVSPLPFDFRIDRWEEHRAHEPDTPFGNEVITLGDVNGDGATDRAIFTSYGTSGTYVLLMNPDGSVQSRSWVDYRSSGTLASAGDIDGDGIEELAVGVGTANAGGSVTLIFLNSDGSVRETSRIEGGSGFGNSVAAIGDLDNDGVNDIAVGATRADGQAGAVYVQFMNADGTVASSTTIGDNIGGGPSLQSFSRMGSSLTNMGDLNGDGVTDLAVGAYYHGQGNVASRSGAVFMLMMNPDGTALSTTRLTRETGIPVDRDAGFGLDVVAIGDLDGNGVNDLAVGALGSGTQSGSVFLVLLNSDGTSKGIRKFHEGAFGAPTEADGTTPIPYFYGRALTNMGDLDGNGIDDLWVSSTRTSTTHLLYLTNGVVRADSSSVTITEGQTASNSGTFVDPGDGSGTLSASVGTVTASGAGVWSWSLPTTDGPLAAPYVDIFLTNDGGDVDSVRFRLDVQNVAPTITDLQFDTSAIDEGGSVVLTGQFSDPGTDDTHTVTIDWGDGSRDVIADVTTNSFSLHHTYLDDPYSGSAEASYQVLVTVVDDDGGEATTVDAAAGQTQRVSVASDGSEAELAAGTFAISGDGRYVTFASSATNLVPNDTNSKRDVFVHDRVTGLTKPISVASDGSEANDHSGQSVLSGNGRYVVFESRASNLVPGDTNGTTDIFVHDLQTGETRRVSVASDGTQANGFSSLPAISANGQYVTFESHAYNLVPGDTNIQRDIFVHNLQTGITELASVASDGTQGNRGGQRPSISADGRYVSFDTDATNLVDGDTNGEFDVFVRDRLTGTTTRASVSSTGAQSDRDALRSQISGDGRHVVFYSNATTLVANTFSRTQVFLHDLITGHTELVSVNDSGDPADENSGYPQPTVSHDGRFVAFVSDGKNLVEGDTNNRPDVFVRDRIDGTTERISVTNDGAQSTGRPTGAAIAANGLVVAFSSDATDLVAGDTNGVADIFVRGLGEPGLASPELLVRNLDPVLADSGDVQLAFQNPVLTREISFSDVGVNDTHTVIVDYGDGSDPQTIAVSPVGARSFDLNHTFTAIGTFTVTVTLRDDDAGEAIDSFDVTVRLNTPPTANAGGPYVVNEGSAIPLSASLTSDPDQDTQSLKVQWNLDGDEEFGESGLDATRGDEIGLQPEFSAALSDDSDSIVVQLRVEDEWGAVDFDSVGITVVNVAPTLQFDSTITVLSGDSFTLDGSFFDPGPDTWTATVNYSDGSGNQTLTLSGNEFQLAHTYSTAGVYSAVVTIDDGDGGVTNKTLTVIVETPPVPDLADLTLISSNVLFHPINPGVGTSVNFEIDVTNNGEIPADNITVSVQVYDYDVDTDTGAYVEIDRGVITSLAENSGTRIGLTWHGTDGQPTLPNEDTYLLVRVVLDPDLTVEESDESNNEAIQVLQIGSPDFGSAGLFATASDRTTTREAYVAVGGQAFYNFGSIPGDKDFPIQNASVTLRVYDSSNNLVKSSGTRTGIGGGFSYFIHAPDRDGVYTLEYEIIEGTLSTVVTATLNVSGETPNAPPRPSGPGGPGYVFSPSIQLMDPVTEEPQPTFPPDNPQIGIPVTIIGSFDYELDQRLDVPVTFNDLFPVAGQMRTFEIGSEVLIIPEGGLDDPALLAMNWVPTAEGLHIIQVIAEPEFAFRARTHVTRAVMVGDLDTTSLTLEYGTSIVPEPVPAFAPLMSASRGFASAFAFSAPMAMATSDAPEPGDTLAFTLNYENTGTTTITGGFLMDVFDETLMGTPVNISHGGIADGNVLRWELGDIEPGASGTVTYEVTINSGAEFPPGAAFVQNTAVLNADQAVAASTSEITVRNNAPVITGLNVDPMLDENGVVTLSGTFSDASIADTHTVQVEWGDGKIETLTIDPGERSFTIPHPYGVDHAPRTTTYDINLSVTDATSQQDTDSVSTQVPENQISPDAKSDDYNVNQAETLLVGIDDGVLANDWPSTTDPLESLLVTAPEHASSFVWNADGTFTYTPEADFLGTDKFSYVAQSSGRPSAATTVSINVHNLAATIESAVITGADEQAVAGETLTLNGTFLDSGTVLAHTGTVDWGDGSESEPLTVSFELGSGSFAANHAYANPGSYTATVTIIDGELETTTSIETTVIEVVNSEPGVTLNEGQLRIIGTDERDIVSVSRRGSLVYVAASFLPSAYWWSLGSVSFPLSDVQKVHAELGAGNDVFSMSAWLVMPTIIDGGDGNDFLYAGGGPSLVLGGAGNDLLRGGRDRSLLVGGTGRDNLIGGQEDDVLIGGEIQGNDGSLSGDALHDQIMSAWNSDNSYADRTDAVTALIDDVDDNERDLLFGLSGRDLYFDGLGDRLLGVRRSGSQAESRR
ncbi:FG-GAP repeat protein [Novipirellula aureliae]|uniref:FG-GAP repeat protein n=1 Tax=Novipirellula aureliae TaxID=2527966 RepID=A0A5C6DHV4_9BACT|nr:PKD domain-containing protein [Novipirellula aureliae]TWU35785.1 FG-GAP repeat protein [Novipirellula aureliae]